MYSRWKSGNFGDFNNLNLWYFKFFFDIFNMVVKNISLVNIYIIVEDLFSKFSKLLYQKRRKSHSISHIFSSSNRFIFELIFPVFAYNKVIVFISDKVFFEYIHNNFLPVQKFFCVNNNNFFYFDFLSLFIKPLWQFRFSQIM